MGSVALSLDERNMSLFGGVRGAGLHLNLGRLPSRYSVSYWYRQCAAPESS